MWNSEKSIKLTLYVVRFLCAVFLVLIVAAPFVFKFYCNLTESSGNEYYVLLITFYACCPSAAVTLYYLNKFLASVRSGNVFIKENVKALRVLSWTCFSAVPLSIPMCFWLLGAFPIPCAAAFMGLFIRVIKNVIEQGTVIKDENDFTI